MVFRVSSRMIKVNNKKNKDTYMKVTFSVTDLMVNPSFVDYNFKGGCSCMFVAIIVYLSKGTLLHHPFQFGVDLLNLFPSNFPGEHLSLLAAIKNLSKPLIK